MAQRVTTKRVTAKQDNVNCEHDRPDANSKLVVEPESFPDVVTQDQNENERKIQKIAVHVLHDQRERTLAKISFARFADRACERIRPERFVIGAAIIITGQPK